MCEKVQVTTMQYDLANEQKHHRESPESSIGEILDTLEKH